jgi:DNA replication protein DnaC
MLTHPTFEKLKTLQLRGMAAALEDQHRTPDITTLTFEERLGLLLDREETSRADRRLKTRLTDAKLRVKASLEDIDHHPKRNLDKGLLLDLASCTWIAKHHNLVITGATGVGKTYLACALAHQACRHGYKALYQRLPRLLHDLEIAKGDGRYRHQLAALQRIDVLLIDDWGGTPMSDNNRRDLLEILDDRYATRSTLITSQLPISAWHDYINDPTLADAILDRFIHNAHTLDLKGPSLRKTNNTLTTPTPTSEG